MTLAAIGGFVSVAMGAFAAHGIADPKVQEWLRTGSTYGFLHTLATFGCAVFMNLGRSEPGSPRRSSCPERRSFRAAFMRWGLAGPVGWEPSRRWAACCSWWAGAS